MERLGPDEEGDRQRLAETPTEHLMKLYRQGSEEGRARLLRALGSRPWGEAEPVFREAVLHHPDPEGRLKGVYSIQQKDSGATQLLREALRDPDARVRKRAAYILANLRGDPSGVDELWGDLSGGNSSQRLSAFCAIARTADEPRRLRAYAEAGQDPSLRVSVAYELRHEPDRIALPLLRPFLKDPDFSVRRQAVDVLQEQVKPLGCIVSGSYEQKEVALEAWLAAHDGVGKVGASSP